MPELVDISTILEELGKTIKARGPEATVALLRNARENVSADHHIQFVIVSVCNETGVSIDKMINAHTTDDSVKYSKAFIIYYLRLDFSITWKQIMQLLNHKNQTWLWELMNLIKGLNPRLSFDAQWVELKIKLDRTIKDYKSKIQK